MVSRKVVVGLTAVVIVAILGSLFIHFQLQSKTPANEQNTQQHTPYTPQVFRAVLSVKGYI
jgi:hypothetical protein